MDCVERGVSPGQGFILLTGPDYELFVITELWLVNVEIEVEGCFRPDYFPVAGSVQGG